MKRICCSIVLPWLVLHLSVTAVPAFNGAFSISDEREVFGYTAEYTVGDDGETLVELAIQYDLGYNEITDANPGIDPWYPGIGRKVLLPTSWILPETGSASPSTEFYTVQTGSFLSPGPAERQFKTLMERLEEGGTDHLRVERIKGFYSVRIGRFGSIEPAERLLRRIKPLFPGSIALKAYIKDERIVRLHRNGSPSEEVETVEDDLIVINLAELRLYLVSAADRGLSVITFPIGIGREGMDTPLGSYRIIEKIKDPSWTIPVSMRAEYPELPAVVPPGPDNPLGSHALRLSNPAYLIHGTNKPLGVGRRVSHGCIRMYPEDIRRLFRMVERGTRVVITYQPVKIGLRGDAPYIEVHRDYLDPGSELQDAVGLLKRRGLLDRVDTGLLYRAIQERRGVPVRLSRR